MKIIVDVNLSASWVDYLNNRGHTAEHWSKIGSHSAPDQEIMDHARQVEAIILTGDMDFAEIHAFQNSSTPSVIQLRAKDLLPSAQGALVVRALNLGAHDLKLGAVVTIKASRMRISKLPIGTTESR